MPVISAILSKLIANLLLIQSLILGMKIDYYSGNHNINGFRSVKMKDSVLKIYQNEWQNSEVSVKRNSDFGDDKKGMIKTRVGFIYFVVLVSSLIVLFTR